MHSAMMTKVDHGWGVAKVSRRESTLVLAVAQLRQ